ncbi:MAG: hypothetical protein IT424_14825, partial [Pirellulales bacterium]|nr:hypothetical protein [Pirellulales bacterium]
MSASIDGSVMKHGRHIAAAVACSLWLTPGGAAAGAENLARIGTPLLGVGVGVTGAGDVTVTHQGPLGEVNDGVLNLNLAADGFQISADGQSGPDGNGADTYAAGISTGAFDFVGVQFAESQYGVTSVRVQNYLANDGGWWGPTNVAAGGAPLGPGDLIAPQVQVSSDGGGSWRTVSASSDYVSLYQGVVRGSGFPKATSGPA